MESDQFARELSCLGVIQTLSVLDVVRALRDEYSRGEKKRSSRGVPDELVLRGVSTIPRENVGGTKTDLLGMSNNRADRSSLLGTRCRDFSLDSNIFC